MIEIKPNVGLSFSYLKTEYDPDNGTVKSWLPITYSVSESELLSLFPAQWTNAFGTEQITAQSLNVCRLATVRMGYNPELYEKLTTSRVKLWKNEVSGDDFAYMLYGSVDNVSERNLVLEFKVQRYEEK